MANRQVTNAHRDAQGDILGVCWKYGNGLAYTTRADVIADIESRTNGYVVEEEAPAVWVVVRTHNGVKYIATEADQISRNNLDNLPPCTPA